VQGAVENSVFEKVALSVEQTAYVGALKITSATRLTDDLGLGRFDFLKLAIYLEEAFDIELPDEALKRFVTIGDIVKYLSSTHMGRSSSSAYLRRHCNFLFCGGSEARARSQTCGTMTASTHIRSGATGPYPDPSFSRTSGSGRVGPIFLRRRVAATSSYDRHPPGSNGSAFAVDPRDGMTCLSEQPFAHALISAPSGTIRCVT
jgi:acyl carrier protein